MFPLRSVALLLAISTVAPGQARSPQYAENIRVTSAWLASPATSLPDGAILFTPSQITPYYGNLAAIGLTKDARNYSRVRKWMDWYLGHLNRTDKWGLSCTIYDYAVDGGQETPTNDADSTDSYAATFLSLGWSYWQTGDHEARAWIRTIEPQLLCIGSVITRTQQSNGLTWAKPDYQIAYLMDNTEVYRGLRDAQQLFAAAFGDGVASDRFRAAADRTLDGIQNLLWDPSHDDYFTYLGAPATDWTVWYPDATAQLFPILQGVIDPASPRATALYATFNAKWPSWTSASSPDGFPWVLVSYTAALMQDKARVDSQHHRGEIRGYRISVDVVLCRSRMVHPCEFVYARQASAMRDRKTLRLVGLLLCCWPVLLGGADRLPAVKLDGHYFSANGRRFIPVGAHWVPAKAGMQWPTQWDPQDIEADFVKMHELGFNTVRFDLLWAWFEPRPGDYNEEAFRQLDYLISLAHRYHIYLHPSLFVGGEVGEAYWDVPWRHGRNPQSDPEMLRLETDLGAQFARRYANETAILAWDLTDEPPFWIVAASTTDAMAINWTRLITGAIRRYDKLHPVVAGVSMEDVGHGPFRPDTIAGEVDFFSVHPYSIYATDLFPDPMLSERGTYGAAYETALSGSAGHPVMVQEMGASSAQYTPERIAAYERVNLYSGLAAGTNGFLLWCYTDAAPAQAHKYPYLRSAHETQFGITTWDRRDRPQAVEFRRFAQVVARMDLSGMEPAPADAGIVVTDEWSKPHGDFSHSGLTGPEMIPYVSTDDADAIAGPKQDNSADNKWLQSSWLTSFLLARRAGFRVDFPREYAEWQNRPMILLPSPLTSTTNYMVHVHTDFWEKAKQYVSNGGVLYASVSADAAIPHMEELFGARLEDTAPASELTLKVVQPFGALKPGDTFHYTVPGSGPQILGRPASRQHRENYRRGSGRPAGARRS